MIVDIEYSSESEIDKSEIDEKENVSKILAVVPLFDSDRNLVSGHDGGTIDGPVYDSDGDMMSQH